MIQRHFLPNAIFNFYNVNNVLIRNINFFRHLTFKYEIKQSSFAINYLSVMKNLDIPLVVSLNLFGI